MTDSTRVAREFYILKTDWDRINESCDLGDSIGIRAYLYPHSSMIDDLIYVREVLADESPRSDLDVNDLVKSAKNISMWLRRMSHLNWEDPTYAPNFKNNHYRLEKLLNQFDELEKSANRESPTLVPPQIETAYLAGPQWLIDQLFKTAVKIDKNKREKVGSTHGEVWHYERLIRSLAANWNEIIKHLGLKSVASDESGKSAKYWRESYEDLQKKWYRNYCEMVEQKSDRIQQLERQLDSNAKICADDIERLQKENAELLDQLAIKTKPCGHDRSAGFGIYCGLCERDELKAKLGEK